MESKFKYGDKIRAITNKYSHARKDMQWEGIVVEIGNGGIFKAKTTHSTGQKPKSILFGLNSEDFELVEPPVSEEIETIIHPNHYNYGKCETYNILEMFLSDEEFKGFLKGNVIKYLHRFEHKNGEEDLKKAKAYIDKLIDFMYCKEEK